MAPTISLHLLSVGIFNYLIECLFQVVCWIFCFVFMIMILDNVINVNVQLVSYVFISLSIEMFSTLFKSSLSFLNRVNAETKQHSKQQRLFARLHAREHQFE